MVEERKCIELDNGQKIYIEPKSEEEKLGDVFYWFFIVLLFFMSFAIK